MFGVLSILAFLAFVGLAIAYFLDRTIDPVTQKVQYPWYRNYYLYGAMAALFLFIMFLFAYLYSVRKEQEGMPSSPSSPSLPSDFSPSLYLLSPPDSLSFEPNQQKIVPPPALQEEAKNMIPFSASPHLASLLSESISNHEANPMYLPPALQEEAKNMIPDQGDEKDEKDEKDEGDHRDEHEGEEGEEGEETNKITLIIQTLIGHLYAVEVDQGSTMTDLMRKLGREEPDVFPFRFTHIIRLDPSSDDTFQEDGEKLLAFVDPDVAVVPEKRLWIYYYPSLTSRFRVRNIRKGKVRILERDLPDSKEKRAPDHYMKIEWENSQGQTEDGYLVQESFLNPESPFFG